MDKNSLAYKVLELLYHRYGQGWTDLVPFLEKEYGSELSSKWREISDGLNIIIGSKIELHSASAHYIGYKLVHDYNPQIGALYNGKLLAQITEAGHTFYRMLNQSSQGNMNINVGGNFTGNLNQVANNQGSIENNFKSKTEAPQKQKKDGATRDITLKVIAGLILAGLIYLIKIWYTHYSS